MRPQLKTIAVVSRVGSESNGKPVMPGTGRIEPNAGNPHPLPLPEGEGVVPGKSLDVYLNATAYWQNVPQSVWDFTIGGYQVMKKWLSYREQRVLGRALTLTEIMEVTAMARRLAALVLLQPKLDESYKFIAASTWTFNSGL